MAKLVLEGGTDVAEVALFCVGSELYNSSEFSSIDDLENENSLIRMPTGADGGFLLHLYVDEDIDCKVFEFCDTGDAITGKFKAASGAIAFGGLESVTPDFKENRNIRSDGIINKGVYSYIAFHTDIPDELIEDQVLAVIGKDGDSYISRPGWIIALSLFLGIILLVLTINTNQLFGIPLIILFFTVRYWLFSYTRSKKYTDLKEAKLGVERNYPSIVIKLESDRSGRGDR